jgi:hypothetical protein
VDGIKDPKLKPPKKKDLKLGLDRSAKDSMDRFSDGPEEPTEKTEAAGNFDSRGLGLGSGASLIPVIEPPDQKDKVDPDGIDADGMADADAKDPELEVPEVEPELGPQPMDAEGSSPEDFIEPTAVDQEPSLNLESIMASFAAVRVRLAEFDAALSQSVARLQMPQVAGEGLSDDVKRAIIQTAENTSQLAERARTGGFVFS